MYLKNILFCDKVHHFHWVSGTVSPATSDNILSVSPVSVCLQLLTASWHFREFYYRPSNQWISLEKSKIVLLFEKLRKTDADGPTGMVTS